MLAQGVFGEVLARAVESQPWWKRYAGTATAIASGVVVLGTWATATWTDLPNWLSTAIGGVVFIASILAQRATKNGLTPHGTAETLEVLAPSIENTVVAAQDTARRTAEQVRDQVDQIKQQAGAAVTEFTNSYGNPISQTAAAVGGVVDSWGRADSGRHRILQ